MKTFKRVNRSKNVNQIEVVPKFCSKSESMILTLWESVCCILYLFCTSNRRLQSLHSHSSQPFKWRCIWIDLGFPNQTQWILNLCCHSTRTRHRRKNKHVGKHRGYKMLNVIQRTIHALRWTSGSHAIHERSGESVWRQPCWWGWKRCTKININSSPM